MTRRQSELADTVATDIQRSGQRREHAARHPSFGGVHGHTRLRFESLGMETLEPRVMMAGDDYASLDALVAGEHAEGGPLREFDTKEWINASDLSADGGMLVTGGRNSGLYGYRTEDLAKGELKPVLALRNTGNPNVQSVAVSPDGKIVVSGGTGKKIVAVDSESGQMLWAKDAAGNVNKITFLDSETVLAQVDNGAIQRVNVRTGAMSTAFPEAGDAVWLFSSDQKGEKTVVGGVTLATYDGPTGEKIRDLQGIPAGLGDVSISPEGSRVGLGGTDGTLVILDSETGKEVARGNAGGWVGKMRLLSEDTVAVLASGQLTLRKVEGNQLVVSKVLATDGNLSSIAFDPNDREILFASNGTKIEAHATGLKRPAPVVTAQAASPAPVEDPERSRRVEEPAAEHGLRPAAAVTEDTTVAAPVNTKAVDAAIVALEEETAFQTEAVLLEKTVEAEVKAAPEVVMETPEVRFELTGMTLTATATGLERPLTIDIMFELPNHDIRSFGGTSIQINHRTGRGSVTITRGEYPPLFVLKGFAHDEAHPGQIAIGDLVGYGENDRGAWDGNIWLSPTSAIRLEALAHERAVPAAASRNALSLRAISMEEIALSAELTGLSSKTLKRMFPDPELAKRGEGDVDYAFEPSLQVLSLDGVNVTVAISTPFQRGFVTIEGGGVLAWREIRSESGTDFETMTLTMDRTKPSGTYRLMFLDRPNGTILKTVALVWDKASCTLTAVDPIAEFVPQASVTVNEGDDPAALFMSAHEQERAQIVMAQAAAGKFVAVNPVTRSALLDTPQGRNSITQQQVHLAALAESADPQFRFIWSDERLYEQFLKARPGWKEENKAQTMKQMNLSGDNFYYYRGAEFDYYRKHLDFYNAAVGRLMEQGIRIVGAARSGGDPEPYFTELWKIYADFGDGRLKEIGIPLPNFQQILDASASVLERQAQALIQSEMAARLATEDADRNFNHPSSTFAGVGEATAPSNRAAEEQASFRRTIDVIMNSEGTGTVSQRIAGYLKEYGGDLMSSVDVIAKAGTLDAGTVGGVEVAGLHEAAETPNSENTMIIVIYGSDQFPQQMEEGGKIAEFDNLVSTLRRDYPEVWLISPGENPSVGVRGFIPGYHVEVGEQQEEIENLIVSRKTNNPNLQFVILVGYSWGGGDVYAVSNWLTNKSGLGLKLSGTIYVDAVKPRSSFAETRLPPGTQSMLNLYQSRPTFIQDTIFYLNGGHVENDQNIQDFTEIDFDRDSNQENHSTIDGAAIPKILDFIYSRIETSPSQ